MLTQGLRGGLWLQNPTQCIHAVHNTRFTVSLTHNYVDATNLGDALADAVSTFEEDLPMLSEMSRKDRLEFWSDTLQVDESGVYKALLGVVGASTSIFTIASAYVDVSDLTDCLGFQSWSRRRRWSPRWRRLRAGITRARRCFTR